MARRKGNICRATKSQKRELRRVCNSFGNSSKKCKSYRKDICS